MNRVITAALVSFLMFATACGTDEPTTSSSRRGLDLRAPSQTVGMRAEGQQPPIAEAAVIRECDDVERFAGGVPLRYLADPPGDVDAAPVCFLQSGFGTLPDLQSREPWSAGVIYMPKGMSVERASYIEAVEAGAIAFEARFGEKRVPPDPASEPDDPDGGHRPARVNGHDGVVARTAERRVWAVWFENVRGTDVLFTLTSGRHPDEVIALANRFGPRT